MNQKNSKNYKNIQKNKKSSNHPSSKIKKNKKDRKNISNRKDVFDILDKFLTGKTKIFFVLAILLTIIFGSLLFDAKISIGGDDSDYIINANNFINGKSFPGWHGAFYPIFLSLPILVFGMNIVLLKAISLVLIIGHLILFHIAFKKYFVPTILIFTLLIVSVNSAILYFGSQTYSEALYMFLQILFIYFFIKLYNNISENKLNYLGLWPYWLILGFLLFLVANTRNIGVVAVISILVFFVVDRKFYALLYIIISYLIFTIPFELYKKLVWGISQSNMSGQFQSILLKNYYNPLEGKENFTGMITRFIENSKVYLDNHFLSIIGLKAPDSQEKNFAIAVILFLFLIIAFIFALKKKNKIIKFIVIYLVTSIVGTFIALQQHWGQQRMIIIYVPLLILVIVWGLAQLFSSKNRYLIMLSLIGFSGLQFFLNYSMFIKIIIAFLAVIFFFNLLNTKNIEKKVFSANLFLQSFLIFLLLLISYKTLDQSIKKVKANQKILVKNLRGDKYYGYTSDWVNYLKMSEYVGKYLPDTTLVSCRKPSMSSIYAKGKSFFGVHMLSTVSPEELLSSVSNNKSGLCIINNTDFKSNKVPYRIQYGFKPFIVGFINSGKDLYGIYDIEENAKIHLYKYLEQYKVPYTTNTDSIKNVLSKNAYGVYPDNLVNMFKTKGVDYLIMANLRVIPSKKTNRTISTMRRHVYFIEQKYPGIFAKVHQIGSDDDEPAILLKINYQKYRL